MGQDIEVIHHTFDPWQRTVTEKPLQWNAAAANSGERHRVLCSAIPDLFDLASNITCESADFVRAARLRLFRLIRRTQNLDWLLLTRQPHNWSKVICEAAEDAHNAIGFTRAFGHDVSEVKDASWYADREYLTQWVAGGIPHNIWLGTSVENQQTADERIPHLLRCPARVRFLSCEPLLGAVRLDECSPDTIDGDTSNPSILNAFSGYVHHPATVRFNPDAKGTDYGIHWVIVGGESGPGARPCNVDWIRSIVSQCKAAGVACFVKQLGSRCEVRRQDITDEWVVKERRFRDPKGGDWNEWSEDLRVREFPVVKGGE